MGATRPSCSIDDLDMNGGLDAKDISGVDSRSLGFVATFFVESPLGTCRVSNGAMLFAGALKLVVLMLVQAILLACKLDRCCLHVFKPVFSFLRTRTLSP